MPFATSRGMDYLFHMPLLLQLSHIVFSFRNAAEVCIVYFVCLFFCFNYLILFFLFATSRGMYCLFCIPLSLHVPHNVLFSSQRAEVWIIYFVFLFCLLISFSVAFRPCYLRIHDHVSTTTEGNYTRITYIAMLFAHSPCFHHHRRKLYTYYVYITRKYIISNI